MMKKHQRPKKSGEKGSKIDIAMPIHASNVKKSRLNFMQHLTVKEKEELVFEKDEKYFSL